MRNIEMNQKSAIISCANKHPLHHRPRSYSYASSELKTVRRLVPQDVVLMRALRDMNLPKFVFEDVPLFLGLIGDLFPGLDCPRVRYPDFNDAVEAVLMEGGYSVLPSQVSVVATPYCL